MAGANDFMLERYADASVRLPPRAAGESWGAYYSRRGRHQSPIEKLMAPLRRRAEPSPVGLGLTLRGRGPARGSDASDTSDASSDSSKDSDSDSNGAGGSGGGNGGVSAGRLQEAAASGDLELVTVLLKRPECDPDDIRGDVAQETALHVAAQYGHQSMLSLLLSHGAAVGPVDLAGQTPLHSAASQGHEEVAAVLLRHGAQLTALDNDGNTAMHLAARFGHIAVARLFLKGVGRKRQGGRVQGKGLGFHQVRWALSHRNRAQGQTPVELAATLDDGGVAMQAVRIDASMISNRAIHSGLHTFWSSPCTSVGAGGVFGSERGSTGNVRPTGGAGSGRDSGGGSHSGGGRAD